MWLVWPLPICFTWMSLTARPIIRFISTIDDRTTNTRKMMRLVAVKRISSFLGKSSPYSYSPIIMTTVLTVDHQRFLNWTDSWNCTQKLKANPITKPPNVSRTCHTKRQFISVQVHILIMTDKADSSNAAASTHFISYIIHPYRYICNFGLVQVYMTIYHNYSTHFHPPMRVALIMFGFKFWQGTAAKEFNPCS